MLSKIKDGFMVGYPKIDSYFKRDADGLVMPFGPVANPMFENVRFWRVTEKIDGTNIRIGVKRDGKKVKVFFKGRKEKSEIPKHLLAELLKYYTPELFAHLLDDKNFQYAVFYGEGYGEKIQKPGKKYKPIGVGFALFDVLINGHWLSFEKMEVLAEQLRIEVVPVVFERMNFTTWKTMLSVFFPAHNYGNIYKNTLNSLVKMESKIAVDPVAMEGFVFTPNPCFYHQSGKPLKFKFKYSDVTKFAHAVVDGKVKL